MRQKEENNTIISVQGLNKSFEDLVIFNSINFNLSKGEILSILGPSGSGKTTLLKCIIGLEHFNSNSESVMIKGRTKDDYLADNRIAYVPQRYSNYPWLSVFDNIKLGTINNPKIHKSEIKDRVNEIINTVGLSGFEQYYVDKISGGMQQRVAIGRAIAQDTDIIAMDEPFGALDFKIREKLQLLVKQLNKTILFVTHDIEEALFIADKLIVLSTIPTSIIAEYKLQFRKKMNPEIKFEEEFITYRKKIQVNISKN